jgi:hypothetical protein
MMKDAVLADGTTISSLYQFFYKSLNRLREFGWQWEIKQHRTQQGMQFAMSVFRGSAVHVVVSDDVEQMVQELLRLAVPASLHHDVRVESNRDG